MKDHTTNCKSAKTAHARRAVASKRMGKTASHLLITTLGLIAVTTSLLSPIAAYAGGDACQADCDAYRAGMVPGQDPAAGHPQMSQSYLRSSECGPMPGSAQRPHGAGAGSMFSHHGGQTRAAATHGAGLDAQGVDLSSQSGDAEWDACFEKLKAQWGEYAQYCQAIDANNAGYTAELVTAVSYTIASATCFIACGAETTGVGSFFKGACVIAGFGAMSADIAANVRVNDATHGSIDNWTESVATLSLSGIGQIATVGTSFGSQGAGRNGSSCWAGAMLGAAAAIKFAGMGSANGGADSACNSLKTFISANPVTLAKANDDTPTTTSEHSSNGPTRTGGGPGGAAFGGGTGGRAGLTASSRAVQESVRDYPNSLRFAQATAGDVFLPIYQGIDGKEKGKDVLQQGAGITAEDLSKRLASGQSMSQVMGSLPGMEGLSAAYGKIEKDVKDGLFVGKNGASLGSGGSVMSSAGAKGSATTAAKPNPFAMLGMKGPGGGEAPKDMSFEKAKRDLASDSNSTDIWHEGFGGSIFQIVSGKLGKTRERVDQLEWDTPLNRALVGLPAKRTPAAANSTH